MRQVLLRELRERGYNGGYTMLKDWLQPQREAARTTAVRRFETPPGKQAQVDWGHLGHPGNDGEEQQMWGFTITLGYSRTDDGRSRAGSETGNAAADARRSLPAVGRVPEEILYDRMKTVWRNRRARRDRLEPGVSGLCALLGLHAAAVPAVSGADQRQSRIGREVRAAKLPVRIAGPGAGVSDGPQRRVAALGRGSRQPAGARDHAGTGAAARWDADQFSHAAV